MFWHWVQVISIHPQNVLRRGCNGNMYWMNRESLLRGRGRSIDVIHLLKVITVLGFTLRLCSSTVCGIVPVELWQIMYIYMTAMSPNLISWSTYMLIGCIFLVIKLRFTNFLVYIRENLWYVILCMCMKQKCKILILFVKWCKDDALMGHCKILMILKIF